MSEPDTASYNSQSGPRAPRLIGRYRIIREIGHGGMGIVYEALDPHLDRRVAIKLPHFVGHPDRQEQARHRFLREARSAAAIEHRNVCAVYDVGEHEERPFVVMSFVDGGSLAEQLRRQPKMEPRDAVTTCLKIASGLEAVHAHGIVHRDLKPANILIRKEDGEPVVMDFGLAQVPNQDEPITVDGAILGTPAYMPPEQAGSDLGGVTPRSDVYSLGVILFEMVTGRRPFEGSGIQILNQLSSAKVPRVSSIRKGVDSELDGIIARATARFPCDRFSDAASLVESLRAWLAKAQPNDEIEPTSFLPVGRFVRWRSRWKIGLATVGGSLALGVCSLSMMLGQPDRTAAVGAVWRGWPVNAPPPALAPFDADEARASQNAWARQLGVPLEHVNSIGMKLRLIPPGEFMMGGTPTEIDQALAAVGDFGFGQETIKSEGPQHRVIITRPFYIGVYEVTQSQYENVTGQNPSHFSKTGQGRDAVAHHETGNFPVESVNWNQAVDFCKRLSEREKLAGSTTPRKGAGRSEKPIEYRLPTEAEWEYACRAGTVSKFGNGDLESSLPSIGWHVANSDARTQAVGRLSPNAFGLFDMHGNVYEWVNDGWDHTYYQDFLNTYAVDPKGPNLSDSRRVIRGGNWFSPALHCRSSLRFADPQTNTRHGIGFRVVMIVNED